MGTRSDSPLVLLSMAPALFVSAILLTPGTWASPANADASANAGLVGPAAAGSIVRTVDGVAGYGASTPVNHTIRGAFASFDLPSPPSCGTRNVALEFIAQIDGNQSGVSDLEQISLTQGCMGGVAVMVGHWIDTQTGNSSNFSLTPTPQPNDTIWLDVSHACGQTTFSAQDRNTTALYSISDPNRPCRSSSPHNPLPTGRGALCAVQPGEIAGRLVPLERFGSVSIDCGVENWLGHERPIGELNLRGYRGANVTIRRYVTYNASGLAPLMSVSRLEGSYRDVFTVSYLRGGP